jgi:hypothetical protein
MVLYARKDVSYVFVPVESGGCGSSHRRPVINGVPQEFRLVCQGCENFLRQDIARTGNKRIRTVNGDYGMKRAERYLGLWGASPDTIPESPDDELHREDVEQKTVTDNAATQTIAFSKIADALAGNTELIAKLAAMMSAEPAVAEPAVKAEPSFDSRECLDCGRPIIRRNGQKGALPQRCPACRETHQARQRQGYRKTTAA